jgi:hypothetical protein
LSFKDVRAKSQERIQLEQRIDLTHLNLLILEQKVSKNMKELKKVHEINQLEAEVNNADARQKKREEVKALKIDGKDFAVKTLSDENTGEADEVKELKYENKKLKDEKEVLKDENISLFYKNKEFIAKNGDVIALKDEVKFLKHIICYGASKEELNKQLKILRNEYHDIYTTRLLTEERKVVQPSLDELYLKIR